MRRLGDMERAQPASHTPASDRRAAWHAAQGAVTVFRRAGLCHRGCVTRAVSSGAASAFPSGWWHLCKRRLAPSSVKCLFRPLPAAPGLKLFPFQLCRNW